MKAILSKEAGGYDLYRINEEGKRVTFASTQDYKQKLSLKNCQAIENGYDLDELINNILPKNGTTGNISERIGFFKGFQKALETLSYKKFSEEDMKRAWLGGTNAGAEFESMRDYDSEDDNEPFEFAEESEKKFIQSLQQTEWEVEVEMQCIDPNCDGINRKGECIPGDKPKLDADGCLILKRV